MRLLIVLGIVILNVAAIAAQRPSIRGRMLEKYGTSAWNQRRSTNRVLKSSDDFSRKLVKEVAKKDRGNFIVSPLGVSMTLAMSAFGARGRTEMQLRKALGLSNDEESRKIGYQTVTDYLNSFQKAELHVANRVFLSSEITPNPQFADTMERAFRSQAQTLNFYDAAKSSQTINRWGAAETNNRITEVVSPGDFGSDTVMTLVNAVYFKGTWLKKFDPEVTRDSPFYHEDGTHKNIPTMDAVLNVTYGEYPEVDATFIQLPYQSEDNQHNISMFIVLPNKRDGLTTVDENYDKISISQLIQRGIYQNVDMLIPKFKIEGELDLNGPLQRMGMTDMFDASRADFSGITGGGYTQDPNEVISTGRIVVNKVMQKAVVEVNEEGSEAAAVTVELFESRSFGPKYTRFIANHPFYAIIATTGKHPINLFTLRFTG
ncbi:serine protease inhibitor 3/4-like isoform X2 [Venturia canescens]|uniref:serine protease inhibitor 3/4-like isoform X2 n=1 Tax=Venturia canescens TaxID=32260 RepID=UPI001C9CE27A|nr:serine protease inhibitor 3/4-like isoform X2 [Venturia canescens]